MRILIFIVALTLSACRADDAGVEPSASAKTEENTAAARKPCVPEWQAVARGIEYRALNCSGDRLDLHLVRIDPKVASVEAKLQSGSAEDVAGDAAFALNANFFDENLRALGVVLSGKQSLNPLHPVEWQSVFMVDDEGKASIVPVPRWKSVSDTASAAVQAGPRLVVDGEKNKVAQARPSLRSGACIQDDGRVIFFATPQESMFDVWQMVDLAHASETDRGMGCHDAMLFDGGPSVQLFVRLPDGPIIVDGDKRVPAFIVGRARSK
jgi:uncharacterized protein YigE (DUF2233 family)